MSGTAERVPADRSERRRRLNRDQVVDAALAVVRADGIDALSMRRVAQVLDTGAMTLYRHVRDRDDLLLGMLDRVAQDVTEPPPQIDDRDEIAAVFQVIHSVFRAEPWIVRVLLFEGRGSMKILPLIERIFAALDRLGCRGEEAVDIYLLLLHYAYGESLSFQTVSKREETRATFRAMTGSAYPAVATAVAATENWSYDEFERNVRRVLSSLG